jgi:hypothetical protein
MARSFRFIVLAALGLTLGALAFTRSLTLRRFIESTPCAAQLRAVTKRSPREAVAQAL